MFVYVWEYAVAEADRDRFVEAYGPEGTWVELFRGADGFLGTELLADANDPNRFMTIDRWSSEQARDRFRATFADQFEALDRECDALTLDERFVGDFHVVSGKNE